MKFEFLVIAGGRFPPVSFGRKMRKLCDQVIVVDRGLDYARQATIDWDYFVGDADSLSSTSRNILYRKDKISNCADVKILPRHKSLSDLEFALRYVLAKKKSARCLILASHQDHEGRSDHLFANILLALKYPGQVILADERSWIAGLKNEIFHLESKKSVPFSLISPKLFKVTIKNALYPAINQRISSPTHGVSNKTGIGTKIQIQGSALLFVSAPLK